MIKKTDKSPKDHVPEEPPKDQKHDPQAGLQPIHDEDPDKSSPKHPLTKDDYPE